MIDLACINIVTTYVFLTNHQWVSVYAFVSLEENKSSLPVLCYLQENLAARKRLDINHLQDIFLYFNNLRIHVYINKKFHTHNVPALYVIYVFYLQYLQ